MTKKIIWNIEKRKLSELKPHEENPREFTEKGMKDLEKSINAIGFAQPININTNGTVLSGHARLEKLKDMGEAEVDVYIPSKKLTQKQEKEVLIRMNANTAGEWDIEKLSLDFDSEDLNEWGLDLDLSLDEEENDIEEDEAPEPQEEVISKEGDIWTLGNHRLMCGDSTDAGSVAILMNGDKADMVFTDPPYNIGYDFHNNGMVQSGQRTARFDEIKNDKMGDDEFLMFVGSALANIFEVLKEGCSYYISAGRESTQVFNNELVKLGLHIQSWLIWAKENFNISRLDYHPKHEIITYGWKKGAAHNWFGDRSQTDVINISREKPGTAVHPTQKPIELIAYFILNSCKSRGIVIDLFGGSGSTLIACEQTNRNCCMMELDPKYVDVIIRRWQNLTNKQAIREDGKTFSEVENGK